MIFIFVSVTEYKSKMHTVKKTSNKTKEEQEATQKKGIKV